MKRRSPSLVTLSVTIVVPGCARNTTAAAKAMRRLRFRTVGAAAAPVLLLLLLLLSLLLPSTSPRRSQSGS
jgi:hypothetical protein